MSKLDSVDGTKRDGLNQVDLRDVPQYQDKPVSILTKIEHAPESFFLEKTDHVPELPTNAEFKVKRERLEEYQSPSFFNGSFLNVEHVSIERGALRIKTGKTDLFSYLAASSFYAGHEGDNPVRPLSVQATLFSPGGTHVLVERRDKSVADFPDKLSEFGGAMNEKDMDIVEAVRSRIEKKWGIPVAREQVVPTGFMRENAGNIYCAAFSVELTQEQFDDAYARGRDVATDPHAPEESQKRRFYMVNTDRSIFSRGTPERSIENLFIKNRGISEWNYLGFYNLMIALAAKKLRTPAEVRSLVADAERNFREWGVDFQYPIERIDKKS